MKIYLIGFQILEMSYIFGLEYYRSFIGCYHYYSFATYSIIFIHPLFFKMFSQWVCIESLYINGKLLMCEHYVLYLCVPQKRGIMMLCAYHTFTTYYLAGGNFLCPEYNVNSEHIFSK